MEITDDHMEYAVVQRLQEMLHDRNPRFRVTSAYAYFAAILYWSSQRMRTNTVQDNSAAAVAANGVWQKLSDENVSDRPWQVVIAEDEDVQIPRAAIAATASRSFLGRTAQQLIKNLRDAVAHGDARNVVPYNSNGLLRGFKFKCSNRDRARNVVWQGTIILGGDDMVRIANQIGNRFCSALERVSRSRHLKRDVEDIGEAA